MPGRSAAQRNEKSVERHRSMRDRVGNVKATTPCADCGSKYPAYVMDFDHVRGDKQTNISALISSHAGWPRIEAEIAKCDVVCANCHRERTHQRKSSDDA